jgi:hypothetical protein
MPPLFSGSTRKLMQTRLLIAPALLFASACATAGSQQTPARAVAVYYSVLEVPCDFEEIGTVSIRAEVMGGISHDEKMRHALGEAGAEVEGADAVLLPETVERGGARAGVIGGSPVSVTWVGQAIRLLPGTCGDSLTPVRVGLTSTSR